MATAGPKSSFRICDILSPKDLSTVVQTSTRVELNGYEPDDQHPGTPDSSDLESENLKFGSESGMTQMIPLSLASGQFDSIPNSDYSETHPESSSRCHSPNSLKSKKPRKARTAFTDLQLQTLEKSFERQKYLSVQDRMELAAKLGLSDTQVKTWYQNRR